MENKGKKKSSSRNDISLDQAILQWIVDDYDISDEKSRKIVGKSGEKSKLITRKMVMNYLDNRGVLEETDETEFMRSLRKRLYYAIDTVVGPIPMKSKSINAHELLRQKSQSKGRFYVTSANAEFFMYLLWCNEDRADNDDILWLIKNERNYEASESSISRSPSCSNSSRNACSCMAKPSGDKSVKLKRDGSPAIRARFTPDNVMYRFLKSG